MREVLRRVSDPAPAEVTSPLRKGMERRGWFKSGIRAVKYCGEETEKAEVSAVSASL